MTGISGLSSSGSSLDRTLPGGNSDAWSNLLAATSQLKSDAELSAALRTAFTLRTDVAPDTVACSLTEIVDESQLRTPIWSNEIAIELDHAQYDAAKGPCIDAARHQRVFAWGTSHVRYPRFAEAAVQRGVLSSLSVPMQARSHLAALNLYGAADDTFHGRRPRQVAELLARCLSRLLLAAHGPQDGPGEEADGTVDADALATARAQHEQVLRAQHQLTREQGRTALEAFTVLSERSRLERIRIADVADAVLTSSGAHSRGSDV